MNSISLLIEHILNEFQQKSLVALFVQAYLFRSIVNSKGGNLNMPPKKIYPIIDVKFASGIKNINFGFYPYTDVC